jgi:hypothetical protein
MKNSKTKGALDNSSALHEIDFSKLIDIEHKQKGTLFLDLAEHQEKSIHICRELLKVVNKDSETFKSLEMFVEHSQTFGMILHASVMSDTSEKVSIN